MVLIFSQVLVHADLIMRSLDVVSTVIEAAELEYFTIDFQEGETYLIYGTIAMTCTAFRI